MPNLLPFVDEFAPIWRDPRTGQKMPMTAAAWIAAGFEVAGPTERGFWIVDLDSRRSALPPAEAPADLPAQLSTRSPADDTTPDTA